MVTEWNVGDYLKYELRYINHIRNLPPGLSFDINTRLVEGVPTTAGIYGVQLLLFNDTLCNIIFTIHNPRSVSNLPSSQQYWVLSSSTPSSSTPSSSTPSSSTPPSSSTLFSQANRTDVTAIMGLPFTGTLHGSEEDCVAYNLLPGLTLDKISCSIQGTPSALGTTVLETYHQETLQSALYITVLPRPVSTTEVGGTGWSALVIATMVVVGSLMFLLLLLAVITWFKRRRQT